MDPQSQLNNQPVGFHSSDIKNTKSNEKTNYFVQTKDSPNSRRMKRKARYQALKERHRQNALSRRQYLKEWFKIYRAPIAIIFLTVTTIAIILGIIIAVANQPRPSSHASLVDINSNMSKEEITIALTQVFSEEGSDTGLAECERLLPTLSASADLQASIYLHCADQLSRFNNETYNDAIFRYAYAAEELVHSYETAKAISAYEILLGSSEKGTEYDRIASERDPSRASEGSSADSPVPESSSEPIVIDNAEGEITYYDEDLPEDTSELVITDVQEWTEEGEWYEEGNNEGQN